MTKNATYYDVIYHNKINHHNEFYVQYAASTLEDALEVAWLVRKDDEYVYITDPETGKTFVTEDGITLAEAYEF